MTSSLHVALAGLLALAASLHGNAGAASIGCATPQRVGPSAHEAHAHHSNPDSNADHASIAAPAHAPHLRDAPTTHAPGGDSVGDNATHSKCSACAACCVAALPSNAAPPAAQAAAESFPPGSSSAEPVFLTGGPDRPPRRTSA